MNCKSCGKPFSCGCQKTRASDGHVVHKTCLTQYNGTLPESSTPAKNNDMLTNKIQKANQNLNR